MIRIVLGILILVLGVAQQAAALLRRLPSMA